MRWFRMKCDASTTDLAKWPDQCDWGDSKPCNKFNCVDSRNFASTQTISKTNNSKRTETNCTSEEIECSKMKNENNANIGIAVAQLPTLGVITIVGCGSNCVIDSFCVRNSLLGFGLAMRIFDVQNWQPNWHGRTSISSVAIHLHRTRFYWLGLSCEN